MKHLTIYFMFLAMSMAPPAWAGNTTDTRTVVCRLNGGNIVADSLCDQGTKPSTTRTGSLVCLAPASGICDNNVVNGCANGGGVFAQSSDSSFDRWKCHSPDVGGPDSDQCQKAKPASCSNGTSKLLDVYFLADNTMSMRAPIDKVRSRANSIMAKISGGDPRFTNVDARFAVGRYFGDPSEGPQKTCPAGHDTEFGPRGDGTIVCKDVAGPARGGSSIDAYDMTQAMTNNAAAVKSAIDGWQATFGDDVPEGQFYAMQKLSTGGATGWRPNAGHILIWMGDAYGHTETTTVAQAISALQANHTAVIALKVTDQVGFDIDKDGQAQAITSATSGTLQNMDGLSDDQVADLIVNSVATVTNTICP